MTRGASRWRGVARNLFSRPSGAIGATLVLAHVALAVENIVETKAELDRLGADYWSLKGATGPDAEQLFLKDPCGNMVELHQFDKCRCRLKSRVKTG